MSSGIYKLTFPNGKIYIGSATNLNVRYQNHLEKAKEKYKNKRQVVAKAIAKYGVDSVIWEIIETCPLGQLLEREQFYLDTLEPFVRNNKGYNVREIADSNYGIKNSTKTKQRKSIAAKGRVFTKEHKQHMKDSWHKNRGTTYYKQLSDRIQGDKNPAKRPEVAKKISESCMGRTWAGDAERVQKQKCYSKKIMDANWKNVEFVEKMKAIHLGRKNSAKTLERMSNWQQRIYLITDTNDQSYYVSSKGLKEFCKEHNLCYVNLMNTKNKPGKKFKGWYMALVQDRKA